MAKDISRTRKRKKIAVVGAGIGGLVSALKLASDGFEVKVFEGSDYPGGKNTYAEICFWASEYWPYGSDNAFHFSEPFQRSW